MNKRNLVAMLLVLIVGLSACGNNGVQSSRLEADASIAAPTEPPVQERTEEPPSHNDEIRLPPVNEDLIAQGFVIYEQDRHFNFYNMSFSSDTFFELFDSDMNLVYYRRTRHLSITYTSDTIIKIRHSAGSPHRSFLFYHTEKNELTEWVEGYYLGDSFLAWAERRTVDDATKYFLALTRIFDDTVHFEYEIDADFAMWIWTLGISFALSGNELVAHDILWDDGQITYVPRYFFPLYELSATGT